MKIYQLKCDNCNASLKISENGKILCCEHCGAIFMVDDEIEHKETTKNVNVNNTYKKVDEARIKENDTRERIELAKIKERRDEEREDNKQFWLFMFFLVGLVILTSTFLYFKYDRVGPDEIKMTASASDYKGKNYEEVKRELLNAGYINIEIIPLDDLITGWINKDGSVEQVSINGNFNFSEGSVFKKNSNVTITYHSFKSDDS